MSYDVVIPTVGRPSLARLLDALAACPAPLPEVVWVVDDRRAGRSAGLYSHGLHRPALIDVRVLESGGRGPAAARNVGWRTSAAEWIAFLDDDVVPAADWTVRLAGDLAAAGSGVAGVQGRIAVPLPTDRRPTDWERNVAGLQDARWATADLAYRRAALAAVGGFDERFTRNYREDADLGLRLTSAGWEIARGARTTVHPVGPADRWVSLRAQAGNADDVLMARLHGRDWRARAGAPTGRLPRHVATATAGLTALALLATRRPKLAAVASAAWLTGTTELAHARIAPGPKTPSEVTTMLATSALMPFLATGHWLRGKARDRAADRAAAPPAEPVVVSGDASVSAATEAPRSSTGPARSSARPAPSQARTPPQAVLLDRDGTLVHDVPYNADPANVHPMPGAAEALALLRARRIPTAVVSNQSGIARGLLRAEDVDAVNARIEQLLGPLGPWVLCPHAPEDGCGCRKPAPGLIREAARRLGVAPERCAVIGDIGADVEAARAAGARAVLVPTAATRPDEVAAAPEVAPDLLSAVKAVLA